MSKSAGSGFRSSLLLATALSLGLSFGASAQGRGHDRDDLRAPPPIQLLHRAEARIAQLKADLRLNEEQTRHWEAFERVVIDTAKARVDRLNPKPEPAAAPADAAPPPPPPPAPAAPAADATAKPDAPAPPAEADKAGETRPTPRRVEIEPRRRDADEADRMTREADERRMREAEERRAEDRREADERRAERRSERQAERQAERGSRGRDRDEDRMSDGSDELSLMIDMADDSAARAAELKRVAEAARPLYDALERRQRSQLVRFIHRDFAAAPEPAPRRRR